MTPPFQRKYPPSRPTPGDAFWFLFRGHDLLVQQQGAAVTIPLLDDAAVAAFGPQNSLFLGTLNSSQCMTGEVSPETSVPDGWSAVGMRDLYGRLENDVYEIVGYAAHILRWQREGRYCPNCGTQLGELGEQWMRQCPNCDFIGYPLVSPAILVLIHDGPRALLVHKPGWNSRFSIVAGFTEPGETLEQCCAREILEEVGVEVTDIKYIGSQPWPYPHQLMIGFTARYTGGEPTPDKTEIDEAKWFRFDQLPELPGPLSLSRQIIDQWAQQAAVGR